MPNLFAFVHDSNAKSAIQNPILLLKPSLPATKKWFYARILQ